jgi:type I restriction enzyme S subunit
MFMSKVDNLIKELCPNGVPYYELGEIATDIYRGSGITRDQITEKGTPCVRYGEIYTTYDIWFDNCVSFTDENIISNKKYFEYGDVLFAITGERVDEIAKSCVYIGHDKCLAGGDIVVLKHNQNPKYLSYVLSTAAARTQKSKGKVKSKVVHSSVPAIKGIVIPVPPLPIQEEIVRILDTFSELTAELTAELTVELTARKKQYEYYRALLLPDKTRKHVALGDVCKITRGRVMSKEYLRDNAGQYPVYSSQTANSGIFGFIDTYDYDDESITWTTDGANAGSVFYHANEKFSITNVCGLLRVINKQEISTRYLYFLLQIIAKGYVSSGMGNPKLMSNTLSRIQINIPPLEEQKRIVSILDRFDSLCNDLSNGLPAEIEARKKQYEYYRDKLLTFKELKQ